LRVVCTTTATTSSTARPAKIRMLNKCCSSRSACSHAPRGPGAAASSGADERGPRRGAPGGRSRTLTFLASVLLANPEPP
jgi:hypothetical protein